MPTLRPCPQGVARVLAPLLLTVLATLALGPPAHAHDATTTTFLKAHSLKAHSLKAHSGADVTLEVDAEYDLLMKSAWLEASAYEASGHVEQARQLALNADAVTTYVTERLQVTAGDAVCTPAPGPYEVHTRGDRAFALLTLTYACPASDAHVHSVSSALFPDAEGFVHGTRTMLDYDLDGEAGNTLLDEARPTFTTGERSLVDQLGEYVVHGAEHLLSGLDHVLFLLVLILSSRTLREIVLTATTFTLAHSLTFVLAALGLVQAPASFVEPVIAASIAFTALLCLLELPRRARLEPARPTRAGRLRYRLVFVFGLVHGLGFAGALGIDQAWSWGLLVSLLAFNVGIELTQVALIAIVFPGLFALRRWRPGAAQGVTVAVAAVVGVVGAYWTAVRLLAG